MLYAGSMISEFFFKSMSGCPDIVRDLNSPDEIRRKSAPQRLFSVGFFWGVVFGVAISPVLRWMVTVAQAE
jgi:hypothetical protein